MKHMSTKQHILHALGQRFVAGLGKHIYVHMAARLKWPEELVHHLRATFFLDESIDHLLVSED